MITEALIAGACGGLLWLDRFQIFQVMVSRPIVSGPLVGWIVGDLNAGLASGLLFELLWLRRPPVGGFISPDVTLASIANSAVSASVRTETGAELLSIVFLSFVTLLPIAFLGTKLDILLRTLVGKIAHAAEKVQFSGGERAVIPYFAVALGLGFSLAFLFLVPIILFGTFFLAHLVPLIPPIVMRALGTAFFVVPLLGIIDLLVGLEHTRHTILFLVGFLAALGGSFILGLLG